MSGGLKWFIGIITTILAALIVLFVVVRTHDGPMGIISGGPFTSGEVVSEVTDLSFLDDYQTIDLQTFIPPRSRTMWLVVFDNRPYILSSYMNTAIGKMWKKWPHHVESDNRAILRVDNKLYEFELKRIREGKQIEPVLQKFTDKYQIPLSLDDVESEGTWLFELSPR